MLAGIRWPILADQEAPLDQPPRFLQVLLCLTGRRVRVRIFGWRCLCRVAPYLSTPYCAYPGIAVQSDDTNELCIGDLGAETANLVQFGLTQHDLTGAMIRRLGTNYAKWNQFDVFWNIFTTRSARFAASQVRWLDGVRTEDLVSALPPVPNVDSVVRNTFESVPVSINPPRGWPVVSAIVEFDTRNMAMPEITTVRRGRRPAWRQAPR